MDTVTRAKMILACCSITGAAHGRSGAPAAYSMASVGGSGWDTCGERPTLVYAAPGLATPAARLAWEAERPATLRMGALGGRAVVETPLAWELSTATDAKKALDAYLRQLRAEFMNGLDTESARAVSLALERTRATRDARKGA